MCAVYAVLCVKCRGAGVEASVECVSCELLMRRAWSES